MKGSDALGAHQLAAILGSCHFGDANPEKWALIAGDSVGRGDTHGSALDYGSDVANAFLRYMREDHTMQAVLRAGRNDDATVVFAYTSALRADLPVDAEGALAVAEAAADRRRGRFSAREIADAIADEADGIGLRQVQNVLADFREAGYVDVVEEGGPGSAYEYDLDEEPGLAEIDLPDVEGGAQNDTSRSESSHTWDFALDLADADVDSESTLSQPTVPADSASSPAAAATDPPG